jgi:phosphodiesterase/alkaline phosphatase D-like protein
VSGAQRTTNFGRAHDLRVDAAPRERVFMRFEVNVKSGDVQHVSVLLWSRARSRAGYQVRLVDDTWRERRITFANAPSVSLDYVASGPLKAGAWTAVDVTMLTDEVSGRNDYVSLALTTASPKGLHFASRESGLHGPRLVVERGGREGGLPPEPTEPES